MNAEKVTLEQEQVRKLLHMASGEAALLYIYLESGNPMEQAVAALHLSEDACNRAGALLRQMGLITEQRKASFVPGERPAYSETDVLQAVDSDLDFRSLYGEIQQQLGKVLNTEELKILLGFHRYLGLPVDVITILVSFCREKARQKGNSRSPSLRSIEKEAYYWAEQGIDTFEEATAYICARNVRNSQMEKLKQVLQLRGRNLTPSENRYAESWLEMGFEMDAIALAYDRTCVNTGNLSWAYMNKILARWHEAGLHTAEAVKQGDTKKSAVPVGARGELGQAELDAIRRLMQEDD